MGEIVYLDYDPDTLYAEYNNRGKVADYEAMAADWAKRGDAVRERLAGQAALDLRYGDGPRETFDLFLPEAEHPPLFAFIHGGYWQWNDKEPYAFLADSFVDAGIGFANIEYALCPDVTLEQLVDQIRRAFAHLWREAGELGFDRDRIMVSGHSAGGHLTGVVLTTDWQQYQDGLPPDLVCAAMPISGVFDVEPIRHTPIGDPLGLDAESASRLSPMFALPRTKANTVIALGAHEGREFHRQAEEFASNLRRHGTRVRIDSVFGANHFSVLESLADPAGLLFSRAKSLLGV
ncbi:MAG: alpha/beta hydrolase [Alphaproteobacteria bacterium]|nr:alpha/beta hydrolase [Alphaproteobacteria bacterium]